MLLYPSDTGGNTLHRWPDVYVVSTCLGQYKFRPQRCMWKTEMEINDEEMKANMNYRLSGEFMETAKFITYKCKVQ